MRCASNRNEEAHVTGVELYKIIKVRFIESRNFFVIYRISLMSVNM